MIPSPDELLQDYAASGAEFDRFAAFGRTLGWLTGSELIRLGRMTVAIAGLGGVGGGHALTLARLGIGGFRLADFDRFDIPNLNRQAGAFLSTIGKPKAAVIGAMVRDINPEARITLFEKGITDAEAEAFLEGADLFVDGLDFFVLDVRRRLFALARKKGIPAITLAPLGHGTAWLTFLPESMSFEDYFGFRDGEGEEEKNYVRFMLGLSPKGPHLAGLIDPSRVDFASRAGPSTPMACQMASAVLGSEALKILLNRGTVRAAPHYQQFAPYRGLFVKGRMLWGGANPLHRMKLFLAMRWIRRIAPTRDIHAPSVPENAPEIERILDLARWAPSGDNEQPWRFEIVDPATLRIHVRHEAGANVYEFADGRPVFLAVGGLLETIRLAASRFGLGTDWQLESADGLRIAVTFSDDADLAPDPLADFITWRSVDRRPYRRERLTAAMKQALAEAWGPDFVVKWHEDFAARWAASRLNMKATAIRLGIPECHRVHREVVNFTDPYAPRGLPAAAIGLDPLTVKLMRWANARWSRTKWLNRYLGGALLAGLQLDLRPGLASAAHLSVRWKDEKRASQAGVGDWLFAGAALQRFWLRAESLGLALQPSYAPLCFSWYALEEKKFWEIKGTAERCRKLAMAADALLGAASANAVFFGRIGFAAVPSPSSRSTRQPLSALMLDKG